MESREFLINHLLNKWKTFKYVVPSPNSAIIDVFAKQIVRIAKELMSQERITIDEWKTAFSEEKEILDLLEKLK